MKKSEIKREDLVPWTPWTHHLYQGGKVIRVYHWRNKKTGEEYYSAEYTYKRDYVELTGFRKNKPSFSELERLAVKKGVPVKRFNVPAPFETL